MATFFQKKIKLSLFAILLIAAAFVILVALLIMNLQKPTTEQVVLPDESGEVILLPGKPTDLVFLPASAGGDPVPLDDSQKPSLWNIVYKDYKFGQFSQRLWMCVEADDDRYSDWSVLRTVTGLPSDCMRELYNYLIP